MGNRVRVRFSIRPGSFHRPRSRHWIASWTVRPEAQHAPHDRQGQVQEAPHLDLESGARSSARALAYLQADPVEGNGVVLPDHPILLLIEERARIESAGGNECALGIARPHRKPFVVIGQVRLS